jgi:(p)ppGpp synthase/HD superfamily hydrolase
MSDEPDVPGHRFAGDPLPELGGWSLARVADLAERAHAGQVDKSGRPYLEHPVRVARLLAERGGPPLQQALGLLHDIVEDTDVSLALLGELGLPERVLDGVDALTHRPGEPQADYYRRVRASPDALPVKLADIDDNSAPQRMSQLDEATQQRLAAKYAHARSALVAPGPDRPD